MEQQFKNDVSKEDINAIRAPLIIPLIITVICFTFDLLCNFKFELVECNGFNEYSTLITRTLVSYFFPAFFAAAVTLLWQCYFAKQWSGIKSDKKLFLAIITVIYFCAYFIYLIAMDTGFIYIFLLLSGIYVWLVLSKCIDKVILKKITVEPKACVTGSPN